MWMALGDNHSWVCDSSSQFIASEEAIMGQGLAIEGLGLAWLGTQRLSGSHCSNVNSSLSRRACFVPHRLSYQAALSLSNGFGGLSKLGGEKVKITRTNSFQEVLSP